MSGVHEDMLGLGVPDVRMHFGDRFIIWAHTSKLRPSTRFYDLTEEDNRGVYHLNFDEQEYELVRDLLFYLYHNMTDNRMSRLLTERESVFRICREVLSIAADYGLWEAQKILIEPMQTLFREQALTLMVYHETLGGRVPPGGTDLEDGFSEEFVALTERVYMDPAYAPMRQVVVDFVVETRCVALQFDAFRMLAIDIPEFGRDILSNPKVMITDLIGTDAPIF